MDIYLSFMCLFLPPESCTYSSCKWVFKKLPKPKPEDRR